MSSEIYIDFFISSQTKPINEISDILGMEPDFGENKHSRSKKDKVPRTNIWTLKFPCEAEDRLLKYPQKELLKKLEGKAHIIKGMLEYSDIYIQFVLNLDGDERIQFPVSCEMVEFINAVNVQLEICTY